MSSWLEALCYLFAPNSCWVEDFFALYLKRKTKENDHFFAARSHLKRLIVNLEDSDHGWRETIIRVSGAWEGDCTEEPWRCSSGMELKGTLAQECLSHGRSPGEGQIPVPD